MRSFICSTHHKYKKKTKKYSKFLDLIFKIILKGIGQGIIRSVGGQLYSSIVLFTGFYVFGLPIGISLLLLTSLRTLGYYIGVISGSFVLIIFQYVYIYRIDWEKNAELVI